jgi:hypothetical protein
MTPTERPISHKVLLVDELLKLVREELEERSAATTLTADYSKYRIQGRTR